MSTRFLSFILFVTTLLFYLGAVVIADRPELIWDEGRYQCYAARLLQGTYCTPEKPDVINGPGYPLVLAPLIVAGAPLSTQRGLNALFMALAALFSFRSVLPYAGKKWALGVALLTVLHPSVLRVAPYLMTEPLSLACTAGFAWAFTLALRSEKWAWGSILAAGFALGWLTLTRVFFGHVVMAAACFLLPLLLWKSIRAKVLRALAILGLAFTMCIPWLAYTKSWTGDTLCWSTVSGELLYWMTSTHEGENGHWFSPGDAITKPELIEHHRELFLPYNAMPVKEREALFKTKAMEQLRANPIGVVKNWLSNWSRLFFGFPRSFEREELTTMALIVVNGPILLLMLAALLVAWRKRAQMPLEILLLALLVFIYTGGSSLASALPRFFIVVWPWLGLSIAAVLSRHLRLRVE